MHMKRVKAKIISITKENPATELDHDPNCWLIEGKLDEDIIGWEKARLDVPASEINTEIIESSISEPDPYPRQICSERRRDNSP
jgi:hypothetical protein